MIYLTVLSGNFPYWPRRARVVPREFPLRDKGSDVGAATSSEDARESFITDETNLTEKKGEGERKKEKEEKYFAER